MQVFKYIRIGLFALLALFVLVMAALLIHHAVQLRKEAMIHPAPGKLVSVDKNQMHVYAQGDGPQTLVLLAGHGTSGPVLDFKPLWSRLTGSYRVVIVEKTGYGWSSGPGSRRNVDSILEETREALRLAGESGPYVLVPHSMSGLEAIRWAQSYPEEVVAITALDPAVPTAVEVMPEPPKAQLYIMYVISRLGLSRFMPAEEAELSLPLLKTKALSEQERDDYMAVFYRNAFSRDMLREAALLKENARTVARENVPVAIPMCFFISSDEMIINSNWQQLLIDYLEPVEQSDYHLLDTHHYVHYEKAPEIADAIDTFLTKLTR